MGDDLSSWLKVVAENKITAKNTWQSTLIDHFVDIKQFKDSKGINFQKACCTLDGCVKVYSTRVDDVSEEAMKLLDNFNVEDVKTKISKKKTYETIEKNISNINIKKTSNMAFRDSTFLSLSKKSENDVLLNLLEIDQDGLYKMFISQPVYEIKMCDLKCDEIVFEQKHICPMFLEHENVENMLVENIEPVEEIQYEVYEPDFNNDEESAEQILPSVPIFNPTKFSYFQGWAGPTHWKLRDRKKVRDKKSSKQKEKFVINFMDPIDDTVLFKMGDTLIDQKILKERKEQNRNMLPENYNFKKEDLYAYNILDGFYTANDESNNYNNDAFEPNMILDEPNYIVDEPIDEIVADNLPEDKQHPFLVRKEQKKVDIKKLKSNILCNITKKKNMKLSDLCKEIPKMYDTKEKKDISIHFCIISLLHVANESNIELVQKDNDILIKH